MLALSWMVPQDGQGVSVDMFHLLFYFAVVGGAELAGAEGAMVLKKTDEGYKEYSVPAFKIKPIDTTGAGDTFCAAFLAFHVIKGKSIESSLKIANAAAALKCLKLGARTGMPRESELVEFLKQNGINYYDLK